MATRSKKKNGTTPLISLTAEQLRRLPRPHAGFDQFAEPLLAFYKANIDKVPVSGLDVDAVTASLQAVQSLRAARLEAQNQLDLIDGTLLYHSSLVWSAELEIYMRAQRVGRTDGDTERAIAPFAQFMKAKGRKKPPTPVTPPTTA